MGTYRLVLCLCSRRVCLELGWGPPLATPEYEELHRWGRRCSHKFRLCVVTLVIGAGTAPVRVAARFMPITLFLAGQAFELEVIEIMSAAFVAACDALHLKISDPAARFVAEKVIALAQRGIRDPDVLRTMTLKEFGLSDESPSVAPSE